MQGHRSEDRPARLAGSRPSYGWVRRFLFWAVASLMGSLIGMFVLTELGVPISHGAALWAGVIAVPLLCAGLAVLLERGSQASQEPREWWVWALGGCVMFTLWAGIYFTIGRISSPLELHYFSAQFESRIPLRPSFSLLYILLYPIFLLPYFVVRERGVFRRLVVADLLMFAICSAAFLLFPVAIERPPTPEPVDLGSWVLGMVWDNDVPWNCMPSEHCTAAMVASLAMWETRRRVGLFAMVVTALIGVSTLFTKQHYLVDVVAGYLLAFALHYGLRWSVGTSTVAVRAPALFERILNR